MSFLSPYKISKLQIHRGEAAPQVTTCHKSADLKHVLSIKVCLNNLLYFRKFPLHIAQNQVEI